MGALFASKKVVVVADAIFVGGKAEAIDKIESWQTIGAICLPGVQTIAEGACLFKQDETSIAVAADVVAEIIGGAVEGEAEGLDELETGLAA